ncbi:MAG: PKD domain-containing protein [Thermoplasmata archaeon]|nr:PKD domain-containing protein [Thermoplasmata archaeon]
MSKEPISYTSDDPHTRSRSIASVASGAVITLLLLSALPGGLGAPGVTAHASSPSLANLRPSVASNPCLVSPASTQRHDLVVTSSELQTLVGTRAAFHALFTNGTIGSSYDWAFGDGSSARTLGPSAFHAFTNPGLFAVCVRSTDAWGTVHDSRSSILLFPVLDEGGNDAHGTHAILTGAVVSNGTSGVQPTALIQAGGSVTVSVLVSVSPTNPAATSLGSTFLLSANAGTHGTLSKVSVNPTGTSRAKVSFNPSTPAGLYELTYSLSTTTPINGSNVLSWSNFTFTIAVGASLGGHAVPTPATGHAGVLNVFETAPGGASTLDPAISYETVGGEVISNVYQNLVDWNQSGPNPQVNPILPDLGTCVPGSFECSSLYGSSLVTNTSVTFVINNQSRFYDGATGKSWGVWPTDVLFSVVRTMGFATYPCWGCNNGWMISQALLPSGNGAWDGGLHAPGNNTPQHEYAAVALNQSTTCPAIALVSQHGCVTFDFPSSSVSPGSPRFFLDVLAGPWGGAVVPCGWFSASAQGAGIPYWTAGNVSGTGDHPCAAPGQPGYGVVPSSVPVTGWDSWEIAGSLPPWVGTVSGSMAGSGPYTLAAYTPGSSYTLQANPGWRANPNCHVAGCMPASGPAARTVFVDWATGFGAGQSAISSGAADVASYSVTNATSVVRQLEAGVLSVRVVPSRTTYFDPLNLNYNVSVANTIAGRALTAPATVLTDLNLRQFLIHSYPYDRSMSSSYDAGGLAYRFEQGGAIPSFFGASTPTNISWPSGGADTNPADAGGAAWWWNLTSHDGAAGGHCTPSHPCSFLMTFVNGTTADEKAQKIWVASIIAISGGAIRPVLKGLTFLQTVINSLYTPPGSNPQTVSSGLGWVVDYPDPTDFVTPLYLPDTSYTFSDAIAEELSLFNSSSCPVAVTHYSSLSTPIPMGCQGTAYAAMVGALRAAALGPLTPARLLLYDEAEQVALRLGLYVSTGQGMNVLTFAPWIDSSSVPSGVLTGENMIDWGLLRYTPHPALLAIEAPAASPVPVPLGRSVTLVAIASGGTGGYRYLWSGLPPGCTSVNASSTTCTPTSRGVYNVSVAVTDASGTSVTSAALSLRVASPVAVIGVRRPVRPLSRNA